MVATFDRYLPYAVDWRFLPEEMLLIKDHIRHYLVVGSNYVARTRFLSPLWTGTIGRNIAEKVRRAEVLFIHIPRTGGTSISRVLYNRNLPHYTMEFWRETFGGPLADLPSFAVIRHPVDRLVSTYKMVVAGGTDIVAYSRYHRSRLPGLDSLEAFVDHLSENRDKLSRLTADLREQVDFILDRRGRVMVDRLFALDARRGLPAELGRWLSVPVMPHLNASASLSLEVSRACRRKIEEIYVRDLQLYDHLMENGGVADLRGLDLADVCREGRNPPRIPPPGSSQTPVPSSTIGRT